MKNLLVHRSSLMGLAILWIVLFHSKIDFPNSLAPIRLIQITGYIGVDIFFLLSGIGLVFSYHKKPSTKHFLLKRFIRIIPAFWITLSLVACIDLIVGNFDEILFIYKLLGLDFVLRAQYATWFIPAIMFCYLLFPFYYRLLLETNGIILLIFSSLIALGTSLLLIDTSMSHLMIASIRIPVFLFGVHIGVLLKDPQNSQRSNTLLNSLVFSAIILILAMVALLLIRINTSPEFRWKAGLGWYPSIIIAFPLSMLTAHTFQRYRNRLRWPLTFLQATGALSLEIYLIHTQVFKLPDHFPMPDTTWNLYRFPEYLFYAATSWLLALFLHKFIQKYIQS